MGIHDRDYARAASNRPRSGLALRARWLSVVGWLIIANVAVFTIDAVLARSGVSVAVHMGDYFAPGIDPASLKAPVVRQRPGRAPVGTAVRLPIVERGNPGLIVGERAYQWMAPLHAIGHFSTSKAFFGLEVWRFVTFQFLHADVSHLIFNMFGLFFFGPLVEERLKTRKRCLAFYLACGIFGAVLYLALNTLGYLSRTPIPGLLFVDMSTPLIGASAGVFGVLMASAKIAGQERMYVLGLLPIRIRDGAYIMFVASLLNLLVGGTNAGGDAAHVGGAVAGFFFIRNMRYLKDFFEVFGPPASRAAKPAHRAAPTRGSPDEARLDELLAKVGRSGADSLTEAERAELHRATEARRGRS